MRDQVFISYSHRDRPWLERLQTYLAPLERRGSLRRWDDTLIAPGQRWESEIASALERCRVAVLLVSADFLASEFIGTVELPRLLSAAENQGVLIVPVVLDHCNFDRFPELAQFQAIHPSSEPLETLDESKQKAVLARLALAVETALGLAPAAAASVPVGPPCILVGMPARNPLFCGREDTLAAIQDALSRTRHALLCGLPGFGKSEVSIEFAYRARARYALVCWCAAGSEAELLQGLGRVAVALRLPEAGGADQGAAARAARDALAMQSGWLLVLDAAEDASLLRTWLPASEAGHVVLSSRSAAVTSVAEPIAVEALDTDSAMSLLLRRSRIAPADETVRAAAFRVAELTACLPLALDQAGAYIEETGCSLDDYAELWQEHSCKLLDERGSGSVRGDASLWQAWSMSLQQLQSVSPQALELLRFYALMHLPALPEATLAKAAAQAGGTLARTLGDALARNAALRELQRFAFLRRDPKTRQLGMHAMVGAFLRAGMEAPQRREVAEACLRVLDAAFPAPRFENWPICDPLAVHAAAVLDAGTAEGIESPVAARLAAELAYYLAQRARSREALPHAGRALDWRRRQQLTALADQRALARALMIAGRVHADLAEYAAAEVALKEGVQLLQDQPQAVLERAYLIDRLGVLALDRGDYAAAERSFDETREQLLSAGATSSLEAAQCANDTAVMYYRRGDYAAALEGFDHAAGLRRELLPPSHPTLMSSLHNLAVASARQGQSERARNLHREVLALREQSLGPDHPGVADSLVSLGLMDLKDGEYQTARAGLERAIHIQLARRGPQHPDLATARAALAELALAEGTLDEAQTLFADVLRQRLATLGESHEFSARSLDGLGRVALARGDMQLAAAALRQALPVLTRCLGTSHEITLRCTSNLARLEVAGLPGIEIQ